MTQLDSATLTLMPSWDQEPHGSILIARGEGDGDGIWLRMELTAGCQSVSCESYFTLPAIRDFGAHYQQFMYGSDSPLALCDAEKTASFLFQPLLPKSAMEITVQLRDWWHDGVASYSAELKSARVHVEDFRSLVERLIEWSGG